MGNLPKEASFNLQKFNVMQTLCWLPASSLRGKEQNKKTIPRINFGIAKYISKTSLNTEYIEGKKMDTHKG